MLATIVAKIQERSPLKYNFARKLISLDPRLIAAEPDRAVAMFREVLTKLVDKNGEQLSRLIRYGCSTRNWFQR